MQQVADVTEKVMINNGGSFLLTAADSSIDDQRAQSLFVRDTRLVSSYEILRDCQPPTPIASSAITHRVARYEFTNPELATETGTVPAKKPMMTLRRDMRFWRADEQTEWDITQQNGELIMVCALEVMS